MVKRGGEERLGSGENRRRGLVAMKRGREEMLGSIKKGGEAR